jgi:Na+/proline symporter
VKLAGLDIGIVICYLVITIFIGFYISRKASKNLRSYFLAENKISWPLLGLSNASGMFDISGTMWMVTLMFVYGLKSAWIPWLWPVWNQVFIMIFLAIWLRRSNVITGAQWITHRFGDKLGGRLSHIIVTIFAVISVFGFIAYFFVGIGKFATIFFPWDLAVNGFLSFTSEESYALIIIGITTLYVIKGGIYSVVLTEVLQFVIMTISCFVVAYIAISNVSAQQIMDAVPAGWTEISFGWNLNLDWSGHLASVNDKINSDGFELFGYLFMMMLFKGIFASLAGPVPSYDMQRVLSTKTPEDAAKMSGLSILALLFPRYLMITGFAVLALVHLMPEFQTMGSSIDFELVLPMAIEKFIPVGFKGLLLAGLLAAFMSTFAAFINAAPAYLVNDLYKKYINPDAADKTYVQYSYIASLGIVIVGLICGFFADSINSLTLWITSALYGGYAAANVLKWIWWRFNGYGYFFGMLAGLIASTIVPPLFPDTAAIYIFPIILIASFLGSIGGTLLTPPNDEKVLMQFYKQTYPWGFWGPVIKMIQQTDPDFIANQNFKRDSANVFVGIVWQMTLTVMPIYLVIQKGQPFLIALVLFLATSYWLKIAWYNKLDINK